MIDKEYYFATKQKIQNETISWQDLNEFYYQIEKRYTKIIQLLEKHFKFQTYCWKYEFTRGNINFSEYSRFSEFTFTNLSGIIQGYDC